MTVHVEFFGIPRQRAGVASVDVEADSLGEVVRQLAGRFPRLAKTCLESDRLKSGYTANINGRSFTTDPATPLNDGDSVLILSADAGG